MRIIRICERCRTRWCPSPPDGKCECGGLLREVASGAQPPQAGSPSATGSAASASEQVDQGADSSGRSARESALAAVREYLLREIEEAKERIAIYQEKNFQWQELFTRGQLDAWKGVWWHLSEGQPPDAPPAEGERALARNATR